MNGIDVSELTTGGELDRLVACHVLDGRCVVVGISASIELAWLVVEAMTSKGAAVHIDHWDGNTCPDTTWEVLFVSPWFRGEASCHTAPLAICRAALRAVADAKKLEVFSGERVA